MRWSGEDLFRYSGYFSGFYPEIFKKYANLGDEMLKVFEEYCKDVREGAFPGTEQIRIQ